MIKIKAVDDENVLDVCELKTNQDDICAARERHSYCNAISIAEAKYHSELYPNAIYNNNVLIGFLCINAPKTTQKQRLSAALC